MQKNYEDLFKEHLIPYTKSAKTFESKIVPNLYFAGEVLDIDALTGDILKWEVDFDD